MCSWADWRLASYSILPAPRETNRYEKAERPPPLGGALVTTQTQMLNEPPENNLRAYLRRCSTQGIKPQTARDIAFDLLIPDHAIDKAAHNLAAICHSQSLKRWLAAFLAKGNDNPPLTKLEG